MKLGNGTQMHILLIDNQITSNIAGSFSLMAAKAKLQEKILKVKVMVVQSQIEIHQST